MNQLLSVVIAALFAAASVNAVAQEKKDSPKKEPSAAQKKQQERMKECNLQADGKKLKGDERKKFMNGCLKPAAKKGEAKKAEPKTTDKK